MKSGEIKTALRVLEQKGGMYSGNSKSILRALSFNGSWSDFMSAMGDSVEKTDTGLYLVKHPEYTVENTLQENAHHEIDTVTFALCAANYVLGEGNEQDFEPYEGKYDSLNDVVAALALHIDPEIGTRNYPYETSENIEVYHMERGIYYSSDGLGYFALFGSHSYLQNVA